MSRIIKGTIVDYFLRRHSGESMPRTTIRGRNPGKFLFLLDSAGKPQNNSSETFCNSPVIKQKGQSILELAIFGSIFLGLLGLLLNYGLNYNYQQKATMQAYREAQSASAEGGSYVLMVDKHIPSPSDAFGIGSVAPITSSASVSANYHMQDVAENESELPYTTIEIKGSDATYTKTFTTAGFRSLSDVTKEQVKKYEEIYGATNVCSDPTVGCGATNGKCIEYDTPDPESGQCPWGEEQTTDPDTGEIRCCSAHAVNIKIIDSCQGELMNYDIAKRQCHLIQDEDACRKDCERGGKSASDCQTICSENIEVPWYCNKLDTIFSFQPIEKYKSMGVGQTYTQDTTMYNTLVVVNNAATDNVDWQTTTHRTIYTSDKAGGFNETPVDTVVSQKESKSW